jgi:hypothetical protein
MTVLTEPVGEILARWREAVALGDADAVLAEAATMTVSAADDPERVRIATGARAEGASLAARLAHLAAIESDRGRAVRLVAEQLATADSIGVVSAGPLTTDILDHLFRTAEDLAPVITDRPSVARGLAELGIHPVHEDPAAADRLLIPAVAVHGSRVWSSRSILETADRATGADPTAVLVHARPLAHLDDEARRAFRPEPWVDEAADDRWSQPYRPPAT